MQIYKEATATEVIISDKAQEKKFARDKNFLHRTGGFKPFSPQFDTIQE